MASTLTSKLPSWVLNIMSHGWETFHCITPIEHAEMAESYGTGPLKFVGAEWVPVSIRHIPRPVVDGEKIMLGFLSRAFALDTVLP
jgi:hypothetical protein